MLQEKMIVKLLQEEIPDLLENGGITVKVAECIHAFTNYTVELIKTGDLEQIQKSFRFADQLLSRGSDKIRSMLIVEFMTSVFPLIKKDGCKMDKVKILLKGNLLAEYKYSLIMDIGNWF